MNILTTFLTVAILLMGKIYSLPVDVSEMDVTTGETGTTETTTTTTTTTTTLAPEVDREWEDLVLAGPTVVNYLHLFMVFASRRDEVLYPPAEPILKYIKDNSLRTILLKISSAMQDAFKLAHDDLVRVRSSMNQIPDHLKAGLLLIKAAPDDLLSQLLPYTLRNVDRAADEGSTVSKPTLDRFISINFLLEELVLLLDSTKLTLGSTDYLIEATIYANDMKTQWNLLVKLFRKFSERADTTQRSIDDTFIDPINEAQKSNNFNSQIKRTDRLNDLIPAAIFIDQSSYLLDMMASTYTDIANDYRVNEVTPITPYITMPIESERIIAQRQLWQNIVLQSVKIARLAQERQNGFVETGPSRHVEYGTYLQKAISA
jgi:hypothetical protein